MDYYIQMTVLIYLSLYIILLSIGFFIKKQGTDSIDKGIMKVAYTLFIILSFLTLIGPLYILSLIGVLVPFIFLFFILSSLLLSLLWIESNLIVYILLVIFSVCLAYFASKTYDFIFFIISKLYNHQFIEEMCSRIKNILNKINYRVLTYLILLILYIIKNYLVFEYETLENVPTLFFGLNLPIENLILVSTEALLTFVIIDTIVTNSNKLKKKLVK